MTRSRTAALVLGALALASAGACGSDETLVSPVLSDGGVDAAREAAPPAEAGVPEAGGVKRTIISRNPFGDVAASDNLLWDGDFEWDTAFADSYGWVGAGFIFEPIGTFTQIHIGYACKSGMKCGFITPSQKIGAVGVAPGNAPVEASVWVKPPDPDCTEVTARLIGCTDNLDPDVTLSDDDGKPDADGWCQLHVTAPERQHATCLMVQARFGDGEALVDDAVVRAATGAAPQAARSLSVPSASDRLAVEELRRTFVEALKPRTPPPNAAERAFRRWRGRAP